MKKTMLILGTVILTACACKKDTIKKEIKIDKNISKLTLNDFNGDTLAYIQTKIIDRKEYYIGKKFDVVMNDLNIPIKSFLYSGDPKNITTASSSAFLIYDSFLQVKNKLSKREIPVILVVRWNPPLQEKDLEKLNSENGGRGKWTSKSEAYFKEQIVGDLSRTNYPEKSNYLLLPT
ncbi:MAG: hypothetical protein ABWY22_02975 [Flavobacterium sp.]